MHPVPMTLLLSFFTCSLLLLNTDADVIPQVESLCDVTGGLCSDLVCSTSDISVTLSVPKLIANNIDIPRIHLTDRACTGFPYDEKSVYITWSRDARVCGTELIMTPTHAIFKNHIYLPPDPAAIIVREITVINVTCSYPLSLNVSNGAVRPELSIAYIGIEGRGAFKVRLAIYKNEKYSDNEKYADNSVIPLSTQSNLYVGVYIEDPPTDFNLLMINCYSTPTNNAYDPLKYYILINSCPNAKDETIKVEENGGTSKGMFSVKAFKFIGDYDYVYLHCQVYLCRESCRPNCLSGRSRSDPPVAQGTLTYGPFRYNDEENSVGKTTGFSVITIIGLAVLNMFFV